MIKPLLQFEFCSFNFNLKWSLKKMPLEQQLVLRNLTFEPNCSRYEVTKYFSSSVDNNALLRRVHPWGAACIMSRCFEFTML